MLGASWLLALATGCYASSAGELSEQLEVLGPSWVREHRGTYRGILEHALSVDAYACEPAPAEVFFGHTPPGRRMISGTLPHYDFYHGPMSYQVQRRSDGWHVNVAIAVQSPAFEGRMELADCQLVAQLEGDVECHGRPYSSSSSREVCPKVGRFSAPITRRNVQSLLAHWSVAVQEYYNRDARSFGLPISYDFEFYLIGAKQSSAQASLVLPFKTDCARSPYFHAVRSGWSLPILAHEMGHTLGLLDEYERFSGIFDFYPKAPYPGAERSRMGLSMKAHTVVLPLHHYLVLRRYFCPVSQDAPFAVSF